MVSFQNTNLGVPQWLSGLRIRLCHCCGSSQCCGVGLILGLGTSPCCVGPAKTHTHTHTHTSDLVTLSAYIMSAALFPGSAHLPERPVPSLLFHSLPRSPLSSLCSSHTEPSAPPSLPISPPQGFVPATCHKTFALAISSAWKALLSTLFLVCSSSAFSHQLKFSSSEKPNLTSQYSSLPL